MPSNMIKWLKLPPSVHPSLHPSIPCLHTITHERDRRSLSLLKPLVEVFLQIHNICTSVSASNFVLEINPVLECCRSISTVIQTRSWCARYILYLKSNRSHCRTQKNIGMSTLNNMKYASAHPKLILLSPFSWWKNGIEDVLSEDQKQKSITIHHLHATSRPRTSV